jgi:hypothetical protein
MCVRVCVCVCVCACVCSLECQGLSSFKETTYSYIFISTYLYILCIKRCVCMHTIDIYLTAMMRPVKDLLQKINIYTERTIVEIFSLLFAFLSVIDIQ